LNIQNYNLTISRGSETCFLTFKEQYMFGVAVRRAKEIQIVHDLVHLNWHQRHVDSV
jgi:hypothetical protein